MKNKKASKSKIKEAVKQEVHQEGIADLPFNLASTARGVAGGIGNAVSGMRGNFHLGKVGGQLNKFAEKTTQQWDITKEKVGRSAEKMAGSNNQAVAQAGEELLHHIQAADGEIEKFAQALTAGTPKAVMGGQRGTARRPAQGNSDDAHLMPKKPGQGFAAAGALPSGFNQWLGQQGVDPRMLSRKDYGVMVQKYLDKSGHPQQAPNVHDDQDDAGNDFPDGLGKEIDYQSLKAMKGRASAAVPGGANKPPALQKKPTVIPQPATKPAVQAKPAVAAVPPVAKKPLPPALPKAAPKPIDPNKTQGVTVPPVPAGLSKKSPMSIAPKAPVSDPIRKSVVPQPPQKAKPGVPPTRQQTVPPELSPETEKVLQGFSPEEAKDIAALPDLDKVVKVLQAKHSDPESVVNSLRNLAIFSRTMRPSSDDIKRLKKNMTMMPQTRDHGASENDGAPIPLTNKKLDKPKTAAYSPAMEKPASTDGNKTVGKPPAPAPKASNDDNKTVAPRLMSKKSEKKAPAVSSKAKMSLPGASKKSVAAHRARKPKK